MKRTQQSLLQNGRLKTGILTTIRGFLSSLLLALIMIADVDAQPHIEWEETFSFAQRNRGVAALQVANGGYIIAGTAINYSDSGDGLTEAVAIVIEVDSHGDLQWSTSIGDVADTRTIATGITQTPEGNLIIVGERTGYEVVGAEYGDRQMWVAALGGGGELLWEATLEPGWLDGIVSDPESGATVFGTARVNDVEDLYLGQIDEAGNILWSQTYPDSVGWRASSMMRTRDGSYVLTVSGGRLLKLNALGQVIWRRKVASDLPVGLRSVVETFDSGYAAAGSSSSGLDLGSAYVVKTDSSGVREWDKVIEPTTPDGGRDFEEIVELSPNLYVAVGMECDIQHSCPDILVVGLSDSGGQQSTISIGDPGIEETAEDLVLTADGGVLIVGQKYYVEEDSVDIFITKIAASQFTGQETLRPEWRGKSLSVYPNPASSVVTINVVLADPGSAQLVIFDSVGRRVFASNRRFFPSGSHETKVDLRGLAPGIYVVALRTGQGVDTTALILM